VALALIIPLANAGGVMAHANYDSSTPAKGEVLNASPAQVSITFTQDVQRITGTYGIEVTGPAGSATAGAAALNDEDRSIMTVPLAPNLPPGRYVVEWKNVSDADGDAADGAFSFYIGVQPTAEELAADATLEEQEPTPTATTGAPTPGATPPASSTATPPSKNDDDDGGSGTAITVIIAIAAVAVGLAAGFFGVRWYANRRA
jgi:copper transport protein